MLKDNIEVNDKLIPISDKDKLNIVLTEFEYLRDELLQKFSHHLRLFAILPTALSLIVGYIVGTQKYDILYLLPVLMLPISFRYLWEQQVIEIIGKYIREELTEKRLTDVAGFRNENADCDYDRYWLGYEHYWMHWQTGKIEKPYWAPYWALYYKHAAFFTFIFIPFFPCLIYDSLLLSQYVYIDLGLRSFIPWPIHISILIIYLILVIYLSKRFLR